MHCLTSQGLGNWELRIDYQLKNGTKSYLHYNKFAIGVDKEQYPLTISGFDSIGLTDPFNLDGNSLNGMKFTSRDRDNDLHNSINCATRYGGFWYTTCGGLEINDRYDSSMLYLNGQWHTTPFLEMKVKPQNCICGSNVTNY